MTEHNISIQHRADQAGQEDRYNIKTSGKFQNKTLSTDARSYFTKLHKQNSIMCRAGPEANRSEVILYTNYRDISSAS